MSYYSTTILARSPQAYWRLDESSGTVAHDATANAYNGTLSGTITYNQAGAISHDLTWVGSYQAGELDEATLYNYVLSPAQILQAFIIGTQLRSGGCALMASGTG